MGFLIDTCIWVEVERGRLSPEEIASFTGEEPVYLSPVTVAELRFGAEIATRPELRQKRLAAVERLRQKPLLQIDATTGEVFGSVAAQLRLSGRGHLFRVQDVWLASQAIQHGLRLATFNRKDFEDIPGLDLVVLPSPRR